MEFLDASDEAVQERTPSAASPGLSLSRTSASWPSWVHLTAVGEHPDDGSIELIFHRSDTDTHRIGSDVIARAHEILDAYARSQHDELNQSNAAQQTTPKD
jgi:hypothetical protein